MMQTQNSFSRTVINEGKMGSYYTDLEHCKRLRRLFVFPQDEVCVLEPSIGDGSAVIACTDADKNPNIKIFGVELNDTVAESTANNPYVTECLKADFLEGVRIRNNAFSFCFGNPPYLNDTLDGEKGARMERSFLEKVTYYLAKDGILVWIIPYHVYIEESYFRYVQSRYEVLHTYKFLEYEFEKYKQVVIVARKKKMSEILSKENLGNLLSAVTPLEKVPELPDDFTEKIDVLPSKADAIDLFCSKIFDVDAAYETLQSLPTELKSRFDERVAVPRYLVNDIGNPPIPLKKDSVYLLATSGGGQGITGSEETLDIHLQRGVAEVIEEETLEKTVAGGKTKSHIRATTRTQISMTIVENNGRITVLQ